VVKAGTSIIRRSRAVAAGGSINRHPHIDDGFLKKSAMAYHVFLLRSDAQSGTAEICSGGREPHKGD
jgi:hypothetical protein